MSDDSLVADRAEVERFKKRNALYRALNFSKRRRIAELEKLIEVKENERQRLDDELEENEAQADWKKPICIICDYDLRNDSLHMFALKCSHVYHLECVKLAIKSINPSCRICGELMVLENGIPIHFS